MKDEKMMNIIHDKANIIDIDGSSCSSENDAEIAGYTIH